MVSVCRYNSTTDLDGNSPQRLKRSICKAWTSCHVTCWLKMTSWLWRRITLLHFMIISLNAEFICNHEPFTSFVHHLAYMAVFFINQHNSHDTITIYEAYFILQSALCTMHHLNMSQRVFRYVWRVWIQKPINAHFKVFKVRNIFEVIMKNMTYFLIIFFVFQQL